MKRKLTILALAVAMLGLSAPRPAQADSIIPTLAGVFDAGGGLWAWVYDVNLSTFSQAVPFPAGQEPPDNPPGSAILTFYDFWGAVGAIGPAGWTAALVSSPPGPVLPPGQVCAGLPPVPCQPDSPSIINVMFAYGPGPLPTITGPVSLGLFAIISTSGPGARALHSTFQGQDLACADTACSQTLPNSNFGTYIGPVPEPSTMLLLGTGLLGFLRMSRKKSKKNEAIV